MDKTVSKENSNIQNDVGISVKYCGLNGIEFGIKDNTYLMKPEKIADFLNFVEYYEKWYSHWIIYMAYYDDKYPKGIDKILDDNEEGWGGDEKDRSYSIGANYATFTSDDFKVVDNHEAADKIKEIYEKEFGVDHTLEFDPEQGNCYIYTKDRKEAKQFLEFMYTKIIKPTLDKIKES